MSETGTSTKPRILEESVEVKSFTYRKSFFGTFCKQGLLGSQKMDDHIAKMLSDGWEIDPRSNRAYGRS